MVKLESNLHFITFLLRASLPVGIPHCKEQNARERKHVRNRKCMIQFAQCITAKKTILSTTPCLCASSKCFPKFFIYQFWKTCHCRLLWIPFVYNSKYAKMLLKSTIIFRIYQRGKTTLTKKTKNCQKQTKKKQKFCGCYALIVFSFVFLEKTKIKKNKNKKNRNTNHHWSKKSPMTKQSMHQKITIVTIVKIIVPQNLNIRMITTINGTV